MKKLALILLVLSSLTAFAEQPVYTVKLQATAAFTPDVKRGGTLSFYARRLPSNGGFKPEVLGYTIPVSITSTNPHLALQEISDQVSAATGEKLGRHSDSITDASVAPNHILSCVGERATIVLLLVPKGDGKYDLICSYRFEAGPPPAP